MDFGSLQECIMHEWVSMVERLRNPDLEMHLGTLWLYGMNHDVSNRKLEATSFWFGLWICKWGKQWQTCSFKLRQGHMIWALIPWINGNHGVLKWWSENLSCACGSISIISFTFLNERDWCGWHGNYVYIPICHSRYTGEWWTVTSCSCSDIPHIMQITHRITSSMPFTFFLCLLFIWYIDWLRLC